MAQYFPIMVPDVIASGDILDVYAPYDGSLIGSVEVANESIMQTAVDTAHRLFANRSRWLPITERLVILERAYTLMKNRRALLAKNAAREGGKPLIDSKIEVDRAIEGFKICMETLRTDTGSVIPMNINAASLNRLAMTQKEPIGVVVAISAFNHPVNLIIHQIVPAIAAGCPVIIKPASTTPLSCLRVVEILREAGLPSAWCQPVVLKDIPLVTQLVSDHRIAFLSFIGSAEVGWHLRSQLAPGTRCVLEHGGVAPLIVHKDANLEKALEHILKGGFYHAGQVCVSVQRVYVHKKLLSLFAKQLAQMVTKLTVGDPTDEQTQVGPLITASEVDRVSNWVKDAIHEGATLLAGGHRISNTCYAPTVLLNPSLQSKVSRLEIFGPVVCLYSYDQLDEAISWANDLEFAFQAAIFTQDLDVTLHAYRHLHASTVLVNDHTAFRVDWMPFAGLRHSGYGIGGIPYTMREMQIEKMLIIKSEQL